ncbi:hypothetical protein MMC29_006112 [Sticta canariensis]|nr:hypothetical protein [Sticta canariensis]
MTTILPPIPRFAFTIFEPLLVIAAYVSITLDPSTFASTQLPHVISTPLTPTSHILALQLGNVYGLFGLIGIAVLYTTTEPKVVRNFLIACAIADVGHLAVTYHVMEFADFINLRGWNTITWANIGVTTGLFLTRIGYLLGMFGKGRRELHTSS